MSDLPSALRHRVEAAAENRPGIYRWWGPGDELLYVGKSIRVRTRLLSYFRAERGEKAWQIVRDAARVEWEHVPNEFGALLREMKLIQRHRPRYNVRHKRKRSYAFVKITDGPAPRILPVGGVARDDSTYFGPFPRVGRTRHAVRDLVHVLGLRDCAGDMPIVFGDQLDVFQTAGLDSLARSPRCMRGDLGSCLAPCCGRVEADDYGERVDEARRFLEGRSRKPLRRLRERMQEAVADLDFEYAALLRDRLERLEAFRDEIAAFRGQVESLSFVYRVPGFRGADRVYVVRHGQILARAPHPKSRRARLKVARLVEEVFDEPDRGPGGLSSDSAAEILLVARWFRLRPEELRRTWSPGEWLKTRRPA